VLFSSHQLDLVEDLCEDAVIVDRGRAAAQGPLDELTAGHDPVLEIEVVGADGATWTSLLDPVHFTALGGSDGTVRLSVADGDGSLVERAQPALDLARTAGAIKRFEFERRTLAEVFLELVGHSASEER
jgi:ABC-2 type transport system ATP-binding protein